MRNLALSRLAGRWRFLSLVSILGVATASFGGPLARKDILAALRAGGYIILMRHASSPREAPDAIVANVDNAQHERQLDAEGRSAARRMGEAFRHFRIPVGEVLSSPTYRALETIRLAQLGPVTALPQLGDSGQSMLSDKTGIRGESLRAKSAEVPARGHDTVIVTHYPNITEAFPQDAAGLADGEALILHPDGRGGSQVVARVKIEEWSDLETAR